MSFGQVGLAKEDKNSFDAGCNSLLNAFSVMLIHLCIERVIDKKVLGGWDRFPICVEDALSLGTRLGTDEFHFLVTKGFISLETIQTLPVLGTERLVAEELFCKDLDEPSDRLPVLWG